MKYYYAEAIQTQPKAIAEKAILNCPSDEEAVRVAKSWAAEMGLEDLVVRQAGRRVFPRKRRVCSSCLGLGQVWRHSWKPYVGHLSELVPCRACKGGPR